MKTILLLTNFSAPAENAIKEYLAVFSPKNHENVNYVLLNAWHQPRTGQIQLVNFEDHLQTLSMIDLEAQHHRLLKLFPFLENKLEIVSRRGDIAAVVNAYSEENPTELVVLGTKGSNVIREVLVSTTGRIVRQVHAPVLLIPESQAFKQPERIVFASDMTTCRNEQDFEKLTDIVRTFMAEFIILHIYKDERPESDEFEECMMKYLDGINYSFQYKQHVNVAEGINEFAHNMKVGLLALILRDSGLLANLFKHTITRKIAQKANLPLLIFHA